MTVLNESRSPAWARVGKNIEGMPIDKAMEVAGLNYTVGICDSVARIPITNNGIEDYITVPVKDRRRTYRTDNYMAFKEVGQRYEIFQNHDAVAVMETLVGGGWSPVYGGALGGGAVAFMVGTVPLALRTGEVSPYLAVVNSHDGSTGLRFANTPIRPACMNAIARTFRNATAVFSLRHTSRVTDRLDEARVALRLASAYYRRLDDEIALLLDTPISGPLQEAMLESVYPVKSLEGSARERRLGKRSKLLSHLNSSPTIGPAIAKTAWGMIQAVTELEQWEPKRVAKPGHAERNLAYQLGVAPNGSMSANIYKTLDLMGVGTRP